MTTTEPLLPPRIQACLDAGCQEKLYPALATWSAEELRAANDDLEQVFQRTREWMKKRYHEMLAEPAYRNEKAALDHCFHQALVGLIEMCSEIQDVIDHHLRRLGHMEGSN